MSIQMQGVVTAVTLLVASLLSSEAQAAPHARDGFYLQLTTGLGSAHVAVTGDEMETAGPVNTGLTDHWAASQGGVSAGSSLLIGAALRPGFTLGVGGSFMLFSPGASEPTKNGRPYVLVDVNRSGPQSLAMAGGFVDVYPSAALGWHVQALVGYASAAYAQIAQHPFFNGSPSGIGLMGGVGYDFWFSEHWSFGVLARITYANTWLAQTPYDDNLGSMSQHQTLVAPSLELSFTYH